MVVATVVIGSLGLARLPLFDEVRALLAVLGALGLPIAAGAAVRGRSTWGLGPELALRFAIGNLFIVALAVACNVAHIFSIDLVAALTCSLAMLAVAARLRSSGRRGLPIWGRVELWSQREVGLGMLVGVCGAVAAGGYWRSRSPIPFQSTWDGLLHAGIVDRMLDQDRFSLSLSTLSPSFTFDAYLPAFHLGLGLASRLTGVPVLNLLWAGPLVLVALASSGIFALTRLTWGSPLSATAATFLSGWLMSTRKSTNPLLNLLPASEVVALVPLLLLVLADPDHKRGLRRGLVISLLLCGVHGLMGMLSAGVVLTSWLVARMLAAGGVWRRSLIGVVLLAGGTAAMILALAGPLRTHVPDVTIDPTAFYAGLTPGAGLQERLALMAVSYLPVVPGVLLVAAVAGLIAIRDASHRLAPRAVPVVVLVGFAVPVIGLERLEGFLWIASSVSLGALLRGFELLLRRVTVPPRFSRFVPALAIALATLALLPLLSRPLDAFRDFQRTDTSETGPQSSFSPYELDTIPSFAERHGRRLPVVSDPMTQQIAEGLGTFDSIGGVSTPATLELITAGALFAPKRASARQHLVALQDQVGPFVLVVTGRSERWAAQYVRAVRDGRTPEDLQFTAVFRPWDFSALPSRQLKATKHELLRPIRRSGCVSQEVNRPEIVFFTINCDGSVAH